MPSNATVEIRVSETGWPSNGDDDEAGATPENARRYNGNLMRIVSQNKGTPAAPHEPLHVYVFALFNENLKPGPASERHYGLFQPDRTPAYNLGAVSGSGVGPTGGKGNSSNATSSGGTADSPKAQIGEASSTGYYTISGTKVGSFFTFFIYVYSDKFDLISRRKYIKYMRKCTRLVNLLFN